ncbi:hypothetical protein [Paenibacillus bovis]|uniref:YesK-like protein n=1 Tax=Paenibacillus bovis TaxID=1616788 RepID=A0A172ZBS7_9BACL|nr:hypothetical protein [Paenibacillus bovis]ANF94717.1 hypothetical protein AR543_00835 [Paenibacillus bovis]
MNTLMYIGAGLALVLLIISIILIRRRPGSATVRYIPGLAGVLIGAVLMLFSLFQYGWNALGYLVLSLIIIASSLIVLFIILVIGKRIAGQRRY